MASDPDLETLKNIIFNADETSNAKIAFIKEEVTAKRYQIQSRQIAEKMLEQTVVKSEESTVEL